MTDPSLFDRPFSTDIYYDALARRTLTQADVDRGQRGKARRSDPPTSVEAAATIKDQAENAIRALFTIPRSLTDDELVALIPELYPPTLKSARSRLSKSGFLEDSGERRRSVRGAPMIVWTTESRV